MAFRRRKRHCLAQPAAALLLLLLAAAATAARAAIVWGPCPADWYAGEYAGAQDYIDCAQLPVPLSYLEPEGEQLALWLTRVHPPPGTEPEAEVWALQGGPGDPATGFVPFFLDLQRQQGLNLTAVLPEFRGVGGASRLLCADGRPASLEGCPQEVAANRSHLSHFVMSNAARDVLAALRQEGPSRVPRVLYAMSAGTLWANKMFLLEPSIAELLDAVVLDSMVHPAQYSLALFDYAGDLVDRQWLHRCDLAPACAPHWPTGLVPTWERVVQSMQNGSNTCVGDHWPWLSGRAGADRLRLQLKALAASWWSRPLGPAVIWRLDRCSAEDVAQLEAWMATNGLNETQPPPPPTNLTIPGMFGPFTHNFLIQDLVAFNDWMPPSALQGLNASDPGDRALLAAAADRWQAASLQGANFSLAALADKFPLLWRSPEADPVGQVADIQGMPVLILSGTGDANTPTQYALDLAAQRRQYLLAQVENAGHVLLYTQMDPELAGCVEALLGEAFSRILEGERLTSQTVDTQRCAPGSGGMPPVDWAGSHNCTRALLEAAFGPGAEMYPQARAAQ